MHRRSYRWVSHKDATKKILDMLLPEVRSIHIATRFSPLASHRMLSPRRSSHIPPLDAKPLLTAHHSPSQLHADTEDHQLTDLDHLLAHAEDIDKDFHDKTRFGIRG